MCSATLARQALMNLAGHGGHTGHTGYTGLWRISTRCTMQFRKYRETTTSGYFARQLVYRLMGFQCVPTKPFLFSRQCAVSLHMNDSDNSHYRTHQQSHASSVGGSTEGLSPPSPHTVKAVATTHPPIGGGGAHQGTMAPGGHSSPACVGLQDPGPAGSPPGPQALPSFTPPVSAQIVVTY